MLSTVLTLLVVIVQCTCGGLGSVVGPMGLIKGGTVWEEVWWFDRDWGCVGALLHLTLMIWCLIGSWASVLVPANFAIVGSLV